MSGLERGPACHPERSEGSRRPSSQTLRYAQGDTQDLQMSKPVGESETEMQVFPETSELHRSHTYEVLVLSPR